MIRAVMCKREEYLDPYESVIHLADENVSSSVFPFEATST